MATEMNPAGTVGTAITQYTGRVVNRLQAWPDPKVPGAYAFRAIMRSGKPKEIFFLVKGIVLKNVTMNDLEEVEFTTWPPTSK